MTTSYLFIYLFILNFISVILAQGTGPNTTIPMSIVSRYHGEKQKNSPALGIVLYSLRR